MTGINKKVVWAPKWRSTAYGHEHVLNEMRLCVSPPAHLRGNLNYRLAPPHYFGDYCIGFPPGTKACIDITCSNFPHNFMTKLFYVHALHVESSQFGGVTISLRARATENAFRKISRWFEKEAAHFKRYTFNDAFQNMRVYWECNNFDCFTDKHLRKLAQWYTVFEPGAHVRWLIDALEADRRNCSRKVAQVSSDSSQIVADRVPFTKGYDKSLYSYDAFKKDLVRVVEFPETAVSIGHLIESRLVRAEWKDGVCRIWLCAPYNDNIRIKISGVMRHSGFMAAYEVCTRGKQTHEVATDLVVYSLFRGLDNFIKPMDYDEAVKVTGGYC